MAADRQKLLGAAEKLVNRGRIRAAIEQYRKILEKTPDDTTTLNRVGDLYVRIGRLDKAIELFQTTARQFAREGFLVKAIAILKKILRLDPTLMEVYEMLADLYQRQGLVNDARGQYQVVADYYTKHEDLKRSANVYKKLVDLEPDDPTHRLRLAELYEKQGHSSGAMEQYRGIARLMLARGQVSDALRVSTEALELDPEDLGFLAALIQDFNDTGHAEEAKGLVQRATEMNPAAEGMEGLALESGAVGESPGTPSSVLPEESEKAIGPTSGAESRDPLADIPGLGKFEVWTSEGTENSEPEVNLLDLEDLALGSPSVALPDDPGPALGAQSETVEEFEFDLDDVGAEPPPETPEVAARDEKYEPAPAESQAARSPSEPPAERSVDELFSESEVLQRYGLEEKAVDCLEELLEIDSRHLGALTRLVSLNLRLERPDQTGRAAVRLRSVALQLGVRSVWEETRQDLERVGFPVSEYLPEEAAAPAPPTSRTGAPAGDPPPPDLTWVQDDVEPVPAANLEADTTEETPAIEATLDTEEALDLEEADFFDLASELEAELDSEGEGSQELLIPIQEEQSLEEIVAGFRRGMQETLSAEDYETHFNLGIAYREMELIDEAIGEFQLAAKDPRHLIHCCSMLAGCFVTKGLPELAVKWYERGLESPDLSEQERLGLLFELGDLHLEHGDLASAKECFVEIYGVDSTFRDVVARIEELDATHR